MPKYDKTKRKDDDTGPKACPRSQDQKEACAATFGDAPGSCNCACTNIEDRTRLFNKISSSRWRNRTAQQANLCVLSTTSRRTPSCVNAAKTSTRTELFHQRHSQRRRRTLDNVDYMLGQSMMSKTLIVKLPRRLRVHRLGSDATKFENAQGFG